MRPAFLTGVIACLQRCTTPLSAFRPQFDVICRLSSALPPLNASLQISWPLLLASLALLWTPLVLCVGSELRHKLSYRDRNARVRLWHVLISPWSWLDLLRAGVGAFLLCSLAVTVPDLPNARPWSALAVKALILIAGLLLQVFATGTHRVRTAPLFYILGLAAAVAPWQVPLFGSLLALALTGMTSRLWPVFLLLPPCYAVGAYLFGGLAPLSLLPAALCLPVLYPCLIENRPLAWLVPATREGSARK